MRVTVRIIGLGLCLLLATADISVAQDVNPREADLPTAPEIYSPYVERTATNQDFAEGVFWGDTHLHTSYSTDAGMIGNTIGPEPAYRFARGEEIITALLTSKWVEVQVGATRSYAIWAVTA